MLSITKTTHAGKVLVVVLAEEEPGAYYVVTARPANRAEQQL